MFFQAEKPAMLVVCSRDQKGLLFKIAAILAFNGLSIVDANIHTLNNNALDVFKVNASTGNPIEYANFFFTLKQVKEDLRKGGAAADRPSIVNQARSSAPKTCPLYCVALGGNQRSSMPTASMNFTSFPKGSISVMLLSNQT